MLNFLIIIVLFAATFGGLYLIATKKWNPSTNLICLMNSCLPIQVLTHMSFRTEPFLVIWYSIWLGIVIIIFTYHNGNRIHQYLKKKNFYKRLASKE